MLGSLPVHVLASKDRKGRFAVPSAHDGFFVPEPGEHLARFLEAGKQDGRPCLHVPGGLVVPALHGLAFNQPPPPSIVPPMLLLAIRTGDEIAARLAVESTAHIAILRSLVAAAQRDILAYTVNTIAEEFEYSEPSSARRAVRKGRKLWLRLGAWPWSFGEPDFSGSWWQDPGTVERLLDWRTGLSRRQRERRLRPITT